MNRIAHPKHRLAIILLLLAGWISSGMARDFQEIQQLSDQAGEGARFVVLSPDENHFYVFGSTGIVGHALFPAGAVSPRVQLVRGFLGGQRISAIEHAVFTSDGAQLFAARGPSILRFSRDAASGELAFIDRTELPDCVEGRDETIAALVITDDDRDLYALGCRHVTLLQIDAQTDGISAVDRWPYTETVSFFDRTLALAPGGEELVAFGGLREARVFSRAPATGLLTETQSLGRPGRGGVTYLDDQTIAGNLGNTADNLLEVLAADDDGIYQQLHVVPEDVLGGQAVRRLESLVGTPDRAQLYINLTNGDNDESWLRFDVAADFSLTLAGNQAFPEPVTTHTFADSGRRALLASRDADAWFVADRDPEGGLLTIAGNQRYDGAPDGTQGLAVTGGAALALAPDGRTLALRSIQDFALSFFDVLDDGRLIVAQSEPEADFASGGDSIAFGTANRLYAGNSVTLEIEIWERAGPEEMWVKRVVPPAFIDDLIVFPDQLAISPDRQFLYTLGFAQRISGGALYGLSVFEIEENGDLTSRQAIGLTEDTSQAAFNIAVSDDGRYVYTFAILNGDMINALERQEDGSLLRLPGLTPAGLNLLGTPLPNDLLLYPDGGLPGVVLAQHDESGALEVLRHFTAGDERPGLATGFRITRIPGSNRVYNFTAREDGLHAVFGLDNAGLPFFAGAIELADFGDPVAAVASNDGRFLYLASGTRNTLTVQRIERISRKGFEALDTGEAPPGSRIR